MNGKLPGRQEGLLQICLVKRSSLLCLHIVFMFMPGLEGQNRKGCTRMCTNLTLWAINDVQYFFSHQLLLQNIYDKKVTTGLNALSKTVSWLFNEYLLNVLYDFLYGCLATYLFLCTGKMGRINPEHMIPMPARSNRLCLWIT